MLPLLDTTAYSLSASRYASILDKPKLETESLDPDSGGLENWRKTCSLPMVILKTSSSSSLKKTVLLPTV